MLIMNIVPVTIIPAIIVGTIVIMYRTMRKIERKMQYYGAGALRLRCAHQQQAQEVNDPTLTLTLIFWITEDQTTQYLSMCISTP